MRNGKTIDSWEIGVVAITIALVPFLLFIPFPNNQSFLFAIHNHNIIKQYNIPPIMTIWCINNTQVDLQIHKIIKSNFFLLCIPMSMLTTIIVNMHTTHNIEIP